MNVDSKENGKKKDDDQDHADPECSGEAMPPEELVMDYYHQQLVAMVTTKYGGQSGDFVSVSDVHLRGLWTGKKLDEELEEQQRIADEASSSSQQCGYSAAPPYEEGAGRHGVFCHCEGCVAKQVAATGEENHEEPRAELEPLCDTRAPPSPRRPSEAAWTARQRAWVAATEGREQMNPRQSARKPAARAGARATASSHRVGATTERPTTRSRSPNRKLETLRVWSPMARCVVPPRPTSTIGTRHQRRQRWRSRKMQRAHARQPKSMTRTS